jgi:hypothetical protein
MTEAETASSLTHYAASPAFDGFQMTNNQSSGPEITKNKGLKSCIA